MHPPRIENKMSWKHTKVLTTKPLQHFMKKNEKKKFIMFVMKLFKKFKLQHIFSFAKCIQML